MAERQPIESAGLFVAGLSHRTSAIDLRERLVPPAGMIADILEGFRVEGELDEVVLLSTCNRFEVYGVTRSAQSVLERLAKPLMARLGVNLCDHRSSIYLYETDEAARHLMRVSASLDSLVVGESQILGQVKEAHRVALEGGFTGKLLNRLFRGAIEAGKRVRTETRIGHNTVSVSHAAVDLARKVFGRIEGRSVMVVGVGEMSELVAQYLVAAGVGELVVTNRTLQGAVNMAGRHGGTVVPFESFADRLVSTDIVITATGSPQVILTAAQVESALASRRGRPLFLIDIAVPRDVDPAVGDLEDAYLFNIDDLQQVSDKNYRERVAEAGRAEDLVREEADRFDRWVRSLPVVPLIDRLHGLGDRLVQEEAERLMFRLEGLSPKHKKAVASSMQAVVSRLLHRPLVSLKRLALQDDDPEQVLRLANELFFGTDEVDEGGSPADDSVDPVPSLVGKEA